MVWFHQMPVGGWGGGLIYLNCSVTQLVFVKLGFLSVSHWNNFTNSNQSQHCNEESFSTLLQREEAFMWSENTRLIFFFFSLPMKRCCSNSQSELSQFTSLKSHHIHLGMDVLGCWKSGPLVHRATKSPDQQFQNVPFSYIASMHTS